MLERRTALRALLWKDLSHARYADFVRDHALLDQFGPDNTENRYFSVNIYSSLDSFRSGSWAQDYACPDIVTTAGRLARNQGDASAMLCLGDFYRLNGFDYYYSNYAYLARQPGLGDGPDTFAGEMIPRQALYQRIIANPKANASDRAYALYRAVWCYGPTGRNDCGGDDVDKNQRQAWFRELKTRYAGSQWAEKLDYYW